jgi:hypothetical protein
MSIDVGFYNFVSDLWKQSGLGSYEALLRNVEYLEEKETGENDDRGD